MGAELEAMKIALLGGDQRELTLLDWLVESGAEVQVLGQPAIDKKVETVEHLAELDAEQEAVILPMTGVDEEQFIKKTFGDRKIKLSADFFARLNPGTKLFIGFASPEIKSWCQDYQLELIELAALDQLAILNAVPTAEGAIQLAMEMSSLTLANNNSFVLGLGRVGLTLARRLAALGSTTYGVARKAKDRARAKEMGLIPVCFSQLAAKIGQADFIFNTVPTLVVDRTVLKAVDSKAVIIDLASAPGGTDFKVARELGLKAELALGLPGKVAPETAGQILIEVIPQYLTSN